MITLKNNYASVTVDLHGGAIVDFRLAGNSVNPLSFRFNPEQMPENNRQGACYQGHFACIGRWGLPSAGEIAAGQPNHGLSALIPWEDAGHTQTTLDMHVHSPLDGLRTQRTMQLSKGAAAFEVTEAVSNTAKLGRLYNVVQHPTLAAPFLDSKTRVDSNGTFGINYNFDKNPLQYASEWPEGRCEDGSTMNLNVPDMPCSSVFSFIVDKDDTHGWVTAWSAESNLLIGYVWKRTDYQWISIWQHFEDGDIKYRGIEFGTTGIHKPFNEIIDNDNTRLFTEKNLWYIDAGEKTARSYAAFLMQPPAGFEGVAGISVNNGNVSVKTLNGITINLDTAFKYL